MTGSSETDPSQEITDSRWHPEVELKLAASSEVLDDLLTRPPLVLGERRDEEPRLLESVYFDTADRRLQKAGIALRVRYDGERYVQTLKIGDPERRAYARLERHDAADGFTARAEILRNVAGPAFAALGDSDLRPLFTTRIARRTVMVPTRTAAGSGRIAVAIDTGVVEAGDRTDPVSEIELEQVDGSIGELYDLALSLHQLHPLTIEVRTKSERGYALAGGQPPAWRKAGTLELAADASVDEAIATVLGHCYDHWIANQAAAIDGRDIEGVHQMRVALRRLRAALGFFGASLPETQTTWFGQETRWLARKLGTARDLDVLLADTVAPVRKQRKGDRGLAALAKAIRLRRDDAYAALGKAVGSPRYTTLVLAFGRWISDGGWRSAGDLARDARIATAARDELDALYASVLAKGRDFERLKPAERHALRLEIKKLRYAAQFVGSVYGDTKPFLRLLSDLQDGLGRANDAVVAEAALDEVCDGVEGAKSRRRLEKAAGLVAGWWLATSGQDEGALRAIWHDFQALEPFWRNDKPNLVLVERQPPAT